MCDTGPMAQTVCVIVSAADRERLQVIVADRNRPRKHVERARIVLASADRAPAQRVAQSIGVSRPTVWRWQRRFAEVEVGGLLRDQTRKPGKTPIAADKAAQVVGSMARGRPWLRDGVLLHYRGLSGGAASHERTRLYLENRRWFPANSGL